MKRGERVVSGQLHLGDAEITSLGASQIIAKIEAAKQLAGMNRLLFLPSQNKRLNDLVLEHCRGHDIEVYLWYKVLADNDIIANNDELVENAWGYRGLGVSGRWGSLHSFEESYLFCCSRNAKYNNLLLNRCAPILEQYDGLFADAIGLPLPSKGLESVFTCFCPHCLEGRPKWSEWRKRALDLREHAMSASDEDLERWGTFKAMFADFGLDDFFVERKNDITDLVARYAQLAKSMNKGFGLDAASPVLAMMSAHDYPALGKLADWIKPRVYFRVFGPSSIPLEFYSLIMGMKAWGKRYTFEGVLKYIERSSGFTLPHSVHGLNHINMPVKYAATEIRRATRWSSSEIHPGLEFSVHPDFETGLDNGAVKSFAASGRKSPGIVLCWNLAYIPDNYLRTVGKTLAE